jgi:L-lactate dehydrogenase
MTHETRHGRVVIVGAGHVGGTTAFALMLRGLFAEIVLIDRDSDLAEAQAIDVADAGALTRPARIRAGDYADTAGADILVLTAGAASHGDESRLSLAGRSAVIVRSCIEQAMAAGFAGIVIVASNPVDAMAQVAQQTSGLPPARVIGTGTLLDSMRLRQRIAAAAGFAPSAVDGVVLGEHGDSEVAALSTVRVGGLTLDELPDAQRPDPAGLAEAVRTAGYRIMSGKGHTAFGVATATVRICEAVVRDERAVLPISTRVDGSYGIDGVYLSLPCVIGRAGVIATLTPALSTAEKEALRRSAETIRHAVAGIAAD